MQCINNYMGVTKTQLFTEEENQIAQYAKVLGHPARIAILLHLLKQNSCVNSDLISELGLAQATISQHLRELKSVGIIMGTVEGVSVNYCINPVKWNEIKVLFNKIFEGYNPNCC